MADRDSEKVWYSDEPKPWYAERERKDQWGDTVIDIRESMGDSFATIKHRDAREARRFAAMIAATPWLIRAAKMLIEAHDPNYRLIYESGRTPYDEARDAARTALNYLEEDAGA